MNTPKFEIVRFLASDNVELSGFWSGGNSKRNLIYLHGLGGNGYRSHIVKALAKVCNRNKISFFSINTRGHDLVAGRTKKHVRSNYNGSVYEVFNESIHDVRGAIAYAKSRGAKEFYLVGHSTGANKIAYCIQRGLKVKKVVYLGPGDDIGMQQNILGDREYIKMQKLAAKLRVKNPYQIMPIKNLGYLDISAASYHSLFGARNRMDQFPFRELRPGAKWKRIGNSRIPSLVVLGEEDEYLPNSAATIKSFIENNYKKLPVKLIAGAGHSFSENEDKMAREVLKWISTK